MRFDARGGESADVRTARRAVRLTALAALLFVAGTYLAPLLEGAGLPGVGLARAAYAPACHQDPDRSFAIGGGAQSVCARCAGLYWGGVAGLFGAAWLVVGRRGRPRPAWLFWAAVPTFVDAVLPWIGLTGLSALPRHLLAWPLGFVAGLFLAVGVADLALSLKSESVRGAGSLRVNSLLEGSDG
jgi:uncharacterized membrane protein